MHMIVFLLDAKNLLRGFTGFDQGHYLFLSILFSQNNNDTESVLFADDTSIIVSNSNQIGLQTALNKTLSDIISWFKANFLSLKFNKMYYLEFRTKNCIDTTLDINYFNNTTANVTYTKFLGLVTDDTLTWDNHIDQLISRSNSACYLITAVKAIMSRSALRMLYFSYVHSVISYRLIFRETPLILFKYSE